MEYQSFLRRFSVLFCLLFFLQLAHPLILKDLHSNKDIEDLSEKEDLKNLQSKSYRQDDNSETTALVNYGEQDEIEEYEGSKSKRGAWIVYAGRFLFGVTIFAMSGSLAWDIYLSEKGCCDITNVCSNSDKFKTKYRKIDQVTTWCDYNYTFAENMMSDALAMSNIGDEIWTRVLYFDEFSEKLFTALDSNVIAKYNNRTNELKQVKDRLNGTLETYKDLEFNFVSVFDTVEGTALRVLGLALFAGFYLVKFLIKLYTNSALSAIISANPSVIAIKAGYNKQANALSTYVNSFEKVKSFKAKLASMSVTKAGVQLAANAVMTLMLVAFEIWGIYKTVESCKKMEGESEKALVAIEKEVVNSEILMQNVTYLLGNATENYNNVRDQLISEDLRAFALDVKFLAGNASDQTPQLIQAQADIQNYLDNWQRIAYDNDHSKLHGLMQTLSYGFANVTFKLSCLTKKTNSLNYAVSECKIGSRTVEELFALVQKQEYEDAKKCVDNGYMSWVSFKPYIAQSMTLEGYETDCILNNADKQGSVCDKWYTGHLPDNATATELKLTNEQVVFFISRCPPGDVPPIVEDGVCTYKTTGQDLHSIKIKFYKYNSTQIASIFNACPLLNVTANVEYVICSLKLNDKKDLQYVLDKYVLYDQQQVTDVYTACVQEWTAAEKTFICNLVALNFTREAYPAFYAPYDSKFGADVVDAQAASCVPAGKKKDEALESMKDYVHVDYHHLLNDDTLPLLLHKSMQERLLSEDEKMKNIDDRY